MKPTTQRRQHLPAFTLLFARYISGQISETAWAQFAEIFDSAETTAEERLALAGFVNDAIENLGAGAVVIPKADELQDLLSQTRS